jgi:endonuclease/exonuclease/phosphatase family metal-dependent hydrolase
VIKMAVTNPNLEITLSHIPPFKFLSYNVDQAVREEKFENTKWINRKDRVVALIKDVNADIVCLQEMRKLPNTPSTAKFLAEFDEYYYEVAYRNPSPLAFGQAILYNPKKFYPMKTVKKWLSDTPDQVSDTFSPKSQNFSGYIVLGIQFMHVFEEKIVINAKPFWVFNTHFGLDETLKTQSCHALKRLVSSISNGDEFVVCGDFNFFQDKDGDKQRSILTESCNDLAKGAKTLAGKSVEGTFIGYEHDEFKSDLNNMHSRLDHIFGSKNVSGINPILYTKTMLKEEPAELTTRNYPSDHLPLLIEIKLN